MEQIELIKKSGTKINLFSKEPFCTVSSAVQNITLMGDDNVQLGIRSSRVLDFDIGDKIIIGGDEYSIRTKNTREILSEGKYNYDTVFYGVMYELMKSLYRDTDANGKSSKSTFDLTYNLKDMIKVLIYNVNRDYPGLWIFDEASCPDTEPMTMQFSKQNCLQVLQLTCKETGYEFRIDQNSGKRIIRIGKFGSVVTPPSNAQFFEWGKGKGLYQLREGKVDDKSIITRLWVEGGTNNLRSGYRGYSDRLQLPYPKRRNKREHKLLDGTIIPANSEMIGIENDNDRYIEDSVLKSQIGSIEDVETYDKIFPHRTGIVSALGPDIYSFIDNTMNFDLNEKDANGTKYLIDGVSAKLTFVTGKLAGQQFELKKDKGYDHSKKMFSVIKYTDERGTSFPSTAFNISVGDKYKITDINLPDSYVEDAEEDLWYAGYDDFKGRKQARAQYSLTLDRSYLIDNLPSDADVSVFKCGDYVPIKDERFGIEKNIRIQKISRNLLLDYDYSLTLSDTTTISIQTQTIIDVIEHEKIIEYNKLRDINKARRGWRTTEELKSMIYDTDGYFDGGNIRPNSIETDMLSVGAKSRQFVLVGVILQANVNGKPNVFQATAGQLVHLSLSETPTMWNMSALDVTLEQTGGYYIFAKCSKATNQGTFYITRDQLKVEPLEDPNNYYFQIGIIGSLRADDNFRDFSTTYGFSRINGRTITTGRIESSDKGVYLDLDLGEMGGKIKFVSNGGYKYLSDWADNLHSGGVNLLQGTNTQKSGKSYNVGYFTATRDFVVGEELTVTIKGNIPGSKLFGIWFNSGSYGGYALKKVGEGLYSCTFNVPQNTSTRIVGIYLIGNQAETDNWEFEWIMLETGNQRSDHSESPTEILNRIKDAKQAGADAQDSITETNATVSGLKNFTDTSFSDGIIDRTESAAIEKYKNSLNETMSKAEASYNKVHGNSYLEEPARTNLLNAKINLWGARDTLLSSINSAIANGETTAAEKADVDSKFSSFNSYMSAYQSALEEANKAIQVKLESLSTDKANNAKSDAISEANQYTVDQLRRTEKVIDAQSLDVNTYYPVLIKMSSAVPYRIKLYRTLSGAADGIPSWSTHTGGFSVNCEWTSIGSGWGTIDVRRIIERFSIRFVNGEAVGSIGQMTNSSYEYIYVRGGSRYHFIVEGGTGVEVSLKTEAFTTYNESIGPISSGIVVPVITTDAINAVAADAQAKANEAKAKTQYQTLIDGGLIYSAIMKLFDAGGTGNETAGISGVVNGDTNNPAFWAGGTYADAVAGIANIIHRFNGSSKIGVFFVEKDGKIRVIDPGTGETRFLFNNANIPTLSSLLNSSGYGQTVSNNEAVGIPDLYELANKITITKTGSEIIFTAAFFQITAYGATGENASAVVRLHKDGVLYAIGERISVTLLSNEGYKRKENIVNKFSDLPTGTYSIAIGVSGNASNLKDGWIGASTLKWTFAGAKQTQFGLNGFTSFFSNNHIYFTESGGLDVRGKVNMPGVLAAGRASSQGIMQYGWKMSKISNLDVNKNGTGRYTITHDIGHQKYSPIIIQLGQSVFPSVDYIGNYAVECSFWEKDSGNLTDAPFSFTLIGENY